MLSIRLLTRRCLEVFLGAVGFVTLIVYPLLLVWRWWLQREQETSRFSAPTRPECAPVPPHIYRQPDPMIYSQRYLQSQGMAVTWTNPDVTIRQGGVAVDPDKLLPGTTYDVVARIWNGSTDAPAIGLPVRFSFLSFGVGTQAHPIGDTTVDLGAKGAPNCPTEATQSWTTPVIPGHYCLLIELIWADDANPLNNVGQSNTHVEKLKSPYAKFDFEAANLDRDRHVYRFTSDAYAIGPRPSCERQAVARVSPPTADEIQARAAAARAEHNPAAFPIPAGWSVVVDPTEVAIDPGESRTVTVDVTAPDTFTGSQPFNVHAFDEHDRLIGGVTLVVES